MWSAITRKLRRPAFFAAVRARVEPEGGLALVLAVGISGVLAISMVALIELVQSNESAFGRDRQEQRAFNIAEGGLSYGVSRLSQYDATGSLGVGSKLGSSSAPESYAIEAGSGGFWAEKTATDTWTIWANGVSPAGSVNRTLSIQVRSQTTITTTTVHEAWSQGLFVSDSFGCTEAVGSSALTIPMWVGNDLCLQGNNVIEEPSPVDPKNVTLYVGGRLMLGGNSTRVGASSRPIISAEIVGGCFVGNKAKICSNANQSRVHADGYGSSASSLTKPAVYPDTIYASGDWQNPVCATGSFTFDDDGTRNTSLSQFRLLNLPSYDCTVYDSGGSEVGRLIWDASTRQLTIDGTLFIDAPVQFAGGDTARYSGFGTIYINGSVHQSGQSAVCGPPAVPSGSICINGPWDPNQGVLGVVGLDGWEMTGQAEFNIAAYVVGHYRSSGSAFNTGPIITDSAKISGNSYSTDVPQPPDGLPGVGINPGATTWAAVPGTWRQLPG